MTILRQELQEKKNIDELIAGGYRITHISEELSGDRIRFERPSSGGVATAVEELLLLTADARKYIGGVLIARMGKGSGKSGLAK